MLILHSNSVLGFQEDEQIRVDVRKRINAPPAGGVPLGSPVVVLLHALLEFFLDASNVGIIGTVALHDL